MIAWHIANLTGGAFGGKMPKLEDFLRRASPSRAAEEALRAAKMREAEKAKGRMVIGFAAAAAQMRERREAAEARRAVMARMNEQERAGTVDAEASPS